MAASADSVQETAATENDGVLNGVSTLTRANMDQRLNLDSELTSIVTQDDPNSQDSLTARFAAFLDATLDPEEFGRPSVSSGDALAVHGKGSLLLPLPNANANRSQASLVSPDEEPVMQLDFDNLSPEILSADISIASDNSFIETSSGAAARELKRRFDQYLGVGKNIRSPYAITAFVNQHGKQMYRVGARDMSAPAASMEENELPSVVRASRSKSIGVTPIPSPLVQPGRVPLPANGQMQKTRRPRMSVHSILSPVFKNGTTSSVPASAQPQPTVQDGTRSPPLRKLRKTRSIPNLSAPAPPAEPAPAAAVQPVFTGRPHAHSVSSSDAWPPPPRSNAPADIPVTPVPQDKFAEVMFKAPTGPPSPISSGGMLRPTRSFHSPVESSFEAVSKAHGILHPFGPGIEFDAPGWQSPSHLTSAPPLREAQSFESVLTARADPPSRPVRLGKACARVSDEDLPQSEDLYASDPSTPIANSIYEPAADTLIHSRYSTDLFDVLQSYKGLPVPDRINAVPNPTTIRMSLRDQETAAPRDDPRFVIWGYIKADEREEYSPARTNATDLSSGHSVLSRRKNGKDKSSTSTSGTSTPYIQVEGPQKVLVAATIERWIAQLTSELNYDELLIFFLTYRTYISALDLGHLLICRFHWALGQPNSSHDEMVRRIVRVRTFIAIRYWLFTFFNVDFIPNRELRLLFADWINSLRTDPILTRHKDAPSIVQKLRKVVLECKDSYTKGRESRRGSLDTTSHTTIQSTQSASSPSSAPSPGPVLGDLSNGKFAESLRKAVHPEEPDEDIDLDFVDIDVPNHDFGIGTTSVTTTSIKSSDLAMLRQPLHLAYLQYGKTNPTAALASNIPAHVPLPVAHSALSRVVVNAIGRLGRWKRVLNYRTANTRAPLRPPLGFGGACVDASAFDIEANETGDLLMVRGGVEHYLNMHETRTSRTLTNGQLQQLPITAPSYESPSEIVPRPSLDSEPETLLESVTEASEEDSATEEAVAQANVVTRTVTLASTSVSSVLTSPDSIPVQLQARDSASIISNSHLQMDIVSIDDLDLSDLSSAEDMPAPPPGLRRLSRRLPNRRDFEFVRHSADTVSSMGIRTHDSVLSGGSSVLSDLEPASQSGPDAGPIQAAPIHEWQVNALVDSLSDDDETGDVEAALRRLEGQINQDKQRAKQSKVDNWVQSIRERLTAGQFSNNVEGRRYSSDEEDYGEVQESRFMQEDGSASQSGVSWVGSSRVDSRDSVASPMTAVYSVPGERENDVPVCPLTLEAAAAAAEAHMQPTAEANTAEVPQGIAAGNKAGAGEVKSAAEVASAIPQEEAAPPAQRVRSRASSRPSTSAGSPPVDLPPLAGMDIRADTRFFSTSEKKLKRHRSFILSHKSEVLCQHFAMIDRELFANLKFEELITQDWVNTTECKTVLDWGQFLRERASLQADSVKMSELMVIRSRFNLMANFVVSEIVLTSPADRLMIYSKFIRMAWKAYCSKSFHMLVAILAGLDSDWVKKALRQTSTKPGIWESRMLRDLRQWATPDDDFKHMRQTVEALSETKPVSVASADGPAAGDPQAAGSSRSRAASELKPAPLAACVPFFGVYLAQLHRFSVLPDLIDPTAPNEPVGIDQETNTFYSPAHPEVFSNLAPLPPSVQLEPLINVHKQRLVAGVVKSLVAAQHLAVKVQYPTEKKLFQKCLKLRGLDDDTMQRALAVFSGVDS